MNFTKFDENAIKEFQCDLCYEKKNIVVWKIISTHLNEKYKNSYMCEECWEKIDKDIENDIKERIKKLRIII